MSTPIATRYAMASGFGPPKVKKAKRSTPVVTVSFQERAKQFKEDLYSDGGVLFCKFCQHSIDYMHVDTIKDHLSSKKHVCRKHAKFNNIELSTQPSGSRQITLASVIKSKDAHQDFVLDCVKMCTLADIPLEKVEKMIPSLRKYCAQAGTLPAADQLRSVYVPHLH